MGIYIISSYGLSLLKALPWIEDLNYFVTLFETILMIALSLGIIFIIRNNPILEFLFLGGSHKFGKRGN